MSLTTTTLPDGSIQTVNTNDTTGQIVWTCITPPPTSAVAINLANTATIVANIQTHLGQLETFLAANPNGATLTAAQTAILARMLIGVGRLLVGLTSTVGQAT